MSDQLLASLKGMGFESVDAAIDHIKTLKTADEAAKAGEREAFEKALDDVVADRVTAAVKAQEKDHKAKVGGADLVDPDMGEVAGINGDLWLLQHVMHRHPSTINPEAVQKAYHTHYGRDMKLASIVKALDTVDSSAVVPTDLVSVLLADVEKASPFMANVPIVDMPTNPWEMPYQSGSVTLYGVDESTTDTADAIAGSDAAFDKVTLTAKKVGARAMWSRELDEDAAIAILPTIRNDFIRVTRDGWERNFMFGDETTDNTNINTVGAVPTTTPGAKDPWLQTDGIIHKALVVSTAQAGDVNAAITAKLWLGIRQKMGKYGDTAGDLLSYVNRDLLYDMMSLTEVITPDKYGAAATILTGELARIWGTPLFITDGIPKTAAAGSISSTGGNNTKKSFVIVNRNYGMTVGRRGDLRISVDAYPRTDQYEGIIYSRYDIGFSFAQCVAYGYNAT